jgi:hypothetical protein
MLKLWYGPATGLRLPITMGYLSHQPAQLTVRSIAALTSASVAGAAGAAGGTSLCYLCGKLPTAANPVSAGVIGDPSEWKPKARPSTRWRSV